MKLSRLLAPCLLAFATLASVNAQVSLSPEQQARLNSLPPALRSQALEELRKYNAQAASQSASQPVEQPEVVERAERQEDRGEDRRAEGEFAEATDPVSEEDRSEAKTVRQDLKQFGYDLFAGAPTTFAPATEIPVPVDYVIGPGDQVRIQLFGKENLSYDLYVSRDGVLQVPGLGPLNVAGQSFQELKADLSRRVADQMIGMEAFVTLGELRSMRIFMLGDVNRPGSYTVSSLSTMTNALFVSGGIRRIGTLRNIQLKRAGEIVTTLDLYDLLLEGDTSADARLQPGDVIFVPPVGKLAGIAGEVRRPAIYELSPGESVESLIAMAGGLTSQAFPSISQIERITPDGLKELVDVDLSQAESKALSVADGDIIRIYSSLDRVENFVRLSGAVERPGDYQWQTGMRITDIVSGVHQLLPDADLDYSLVVSRHPVSGQISTRSFSFEQLFLGNDARHDLPLEPKDRILVFDGTEAERDGLAVVIDRLRAQGTSEQPQKIVSVSGRVRHPGDYPLDREMSLSDLVRAAGGFTEDAYTLEAELLRFQDNNKTLRDSLIIPVNLATLEDSSDSRFDVELQPFDQLTIKRIPEWTEQQTIVLEGEVRFPGAYVIERGETLSRVLERAGGLTELGHAESAVFLRESLRLEEQENLRKLRERLRSDIAAASLQREQFSAGGLETAQSLLEQLETTDAVGRLVIDLPDILEGDSDVAIKEGDRLVVPKEPQSVTILGSVNYPTSHLYRDGLNHLDYIELSGGLTRKADKRQIYVVRANGEVVTEQRSRFFPRGGTAIAAGDTIVVPLDVDRIHPLNLWTSTSQIIYQIALGAAAIRSF